MKQIYNFMSFCLLKLIFSFIKIIYLFKFAYVVGN